MHMQRRKGAGKGFFGYEEKGTAYSLSRSQYAVLGIWAVVIVVRHALPVYVDHRRLDRRRNLRRTRPIH